MSKRFFKQKPKYHFFFGNESVGGFNVDFYIDERDIKKCYLEITTTSGVFSMRVSDYTLGYLLTAVSQGREEEVHNFATMMYYFATGLYADLGLSQDAIKAILKHQKRRFKQGESDAAKVDDATEQASQALMEDIASEVGMSEKELKAKREEDKAILRELLNEDKEGEV